MRAGGAGIITIVLVAAFVTCSVASPPRLTKQQYEQKVRTLYAGIQAGFQTTRGAEGRELAERIGNAQKALRHAAQELASARPPADVEEDNRALAEAMEEYAQALEPAISAAATGNHESLARFQNVAALGPVRRMAEAAERMKYKGYDLGPIAKD